MPKYDYNCPEHGCVEIIVPMGLRDCAVCPICGKPVVRVFSPPRGENAVLITAAFRDGYTNPEAAG